MVDQQVTPGLGQIDAVLSDWPESDVIGKLMVSTYLATDFLKKFLAL